MKKTEIDLDGRRKIQLEMLDEIDSFCRQTGIRYSLAYGTLIGAIRHKGFIPWDDDVDIMMPLPDMLRFKEEFVSEKLKYCDVDTWPHYEYGFSRIAYLPTYGRKGLIGKSYGINIDLYPVTSIPSLLSDQEKYFSECEKLLQKRLKLLRLRSVAMRYFPVTNIPGVDSMVRKFRDYILFNGVSYASTDMYHVWAGPVNTRNKRIYDKDLFENLIDVCFEGRQYQSTSLYHEFLTACYGDYMQLPPEDQRHPYHGGEYYWK